MAFVVLQSPMTATAAAASNQPAQTKQQSVKKLKVRSAAEIKHAFGLTAGQRTQAIEISCAPGGSSHCTGDFVTACDNHEGGMSTNPDGSVTCSLPQHD
jgi:hypothetical protein